MRMRIWKRSSLAKRSLATIKGKDIASSHDSRLKEVALNTVRDELAPLSHVFTIAVKEWGMAGITNPVQQIRMIKMLAGVDGLSPGSWSGSFPRRNHPFCPISPGLPLKWP